MCAKWTWGSSSMPVEEQRELWKNAQSLGYTQQMYLKWDNSPVLHSPPKPDSYLHPSG